MSVVLCKLFCVQKIVSILCFKLCKIKYFIGGYIEWKHAIQFDVIEKKKQLINEDMFK